MSICCRKFLLSMTMLLYSGIVSAQIPVEIFAGNKKITTDVMFFKFIKDEKGGQSNFLFFNRNRASIDYAMTNTTNLPQFGSTAAISYNHKKLRGVAPVLVLSVLNRGVYPKTGVQFAAVKKEYTVFSWLVSETLRNPNIDFFFLVRYTYAITHRLQLFSQLELVNAFPTAANNNYSLAQRVRLGLKKQAFQFGAGVDLAQLGKNNFTRSQNWGGFIRYEF